MNVDSEEYLNEKYNKRMIQEKNETLLAINGENLNGKIF
jgi:hypothetical protein